ncbi:MAG: alpha/beta hydrolase [Candidatus Planktophila sp.]|jgi:acetyl esterase|nr:alpha/beta hydrolase [Candidatus Planktophila sp.]
MTLAPEIVKQLSDQKAAGLAQVWQAPVSVIREQTQAKVAFAGPAEPILSVENRFIPGLTADLPVRIYRPTEDKNSPALIYFHGGGWVLNFLDIYDAALHRLANQSGSVIISVNYQKSPEHPFPTPFDDCFATLQYVQSHAEVFGIDANLIGVAGDSAGGNLAAAVALKARDLNLKVAYQMLVYPCTARDFTTKSYIEYATEYGLTTQAMQWFWDQYLQGTDFDQNPYAVPATAKSFKNLAPAIIITAQYDPLISDSEDYVKKLQSDGVGVVYHEFPGMIHGFFANVVATPSSPQAIDFCAKEIRRLLSN